MNCAFLFVVVYFSFSPSTFFSISKTLQGVQAVNKNWYQICCIDHNSINHRVEMDWDSCGLNRCPCVWLRVLGWCLCECVWLGLMRWVQYLPPALTDNVITEISHSSSLSRPGPWLLTRHRGPSQTRSILPSVEVTFSIFYDVKKC